MHRWALMVWSASIPFALLLASSLTLPKEEVMRKHSDTESLSCVGEDRLRGYVSEMWRVRSVDFDTRNFRGGNGWRIKEWKRDEAK